MATSIDYSRSIVEASDEVKDIFCEPCDEDGRKTEAEGFCVDCSEYLCGQCYKNHKLFKAFKNHILQDWDNMPQTITVTGDKDKDIIRGLTLIYEHYIIVADKSNKTVKLIDTKSNNVVTEMIMEEDVWNVAIVKDDKIAVALDTTIHFLSVSKSGSLSKDSSVKVDRLCYDLVYNKDILVVAQASHGLKIINMQGNFLKSVDKDADGKALFSACYGVAINTDNELVYASDFHKNMVTCMTLEGKVKAVYTDKDLKDPWGVTVRNNGSVYVCSTGTRSIHQLSADCTKLEVFHNIPCYSICSNKNKLFIGTGASFKMYDIT